MKKTALITGASSGIGKEFAKIHASRGGDVIIVARREEKLNELKAAIESEHKVKVLVIASDLTQADAPQAIYDQVKAAGFEVDFLINNAGFGARGKFHEQPWETNLSMINLNIVALAALTRLYLPGFVKRNSGKIMNISSTAAFLPGPLQAVYYASKAFVTSFSNALSEELHETNITVTSVHPGATETEFASTSGMDKTSMFSSPVSAYDVALKAYNAMMDGKMNVFAGTTFMRRLQLKLVPLLPKKTVLKMIRKMQEVD